VNLEDNILNHFISSFFLSFLLYSSLLPTSKSKHKEEMPPRQFYKWQQEFKGSTVDNHQQSSLSP
jgi:hypothetical protein